MRVLSLVLLALLLSACRSEAVTLNVAYQSAQCGGLAAGVTLIRDQGALDTAFKPATRFIRKPPVIDFATHQAVLVAMGMKPNSGYGLELSGETGQLVDDVLVLPVLQREPVEGMMYAQVMTSPCMLLTFERVDAIRSVRLSGGSGKDFSP